MGQQQAKALPKVMRKAGDPMNVYNLPSVHTEVIYPTNKRFTTFSICRCWQSVVVFATHNLVAVPSYLSALRVMACFALSLNCAAKFPICDNAHKALQKQGCDCGPAMLEVRQAPSLKPVGVEWVPSGSGGPTNASATHPGGPSAAALFGGAASVSAAVAGQSLLQ
ncbi:hypothetical protein cyc_02521 [Cyclospora cayetanensis]|uniref:Uncharacterized protein n=1 Tax=Cyclospora cayetanensis TaxID=88456 RepID=A0A1D3D9N0_9EIME|nr:hypothetical protein cyc_02521 [Cyclospora cayetanensis]